jgi:hypothetical protein
MPRLIATPTTWYPRGPVRSIGIQSRSITGTMPNGARYESSLERDFMYLLEFDSTVDLYTPQPLTVRYRGLDGAWHRYTPDGLIEWRDDQVVMDRRPLLVEIKYREAFTNNWREWRCRHRAITAFAEERGWQYDIYTETEIRTPLLQNVQFLLPYRKRSSTPETEKWILDTLTEWVESTPAMLISLLYSDKWNQAAVLPIVWKLLAERRIGFPFDEPLGMETPIWALQ